MGRVIAVANQKGGVGKTTTAINLSACLAERGRRVLLVDSDPQGNATSGLGFNKDDINYNVYDGLVEKMPFDDIVVKTDVKRLDLLPGTIQLAGAELELTQTDAREYRMKNLLEPAVDRYDYIFVDCPPSLGLLTINALTAVKSLLIPIQCEFYALEGVAQLMNTLHLVKETFNPDIELEGILMTMYDGRTNLSVQVENEVRKHFADKVYKTIIPRNVRLSEAPSFGQTVLQYDRRSKGAEEYIRLAREVDRKK